MNTTGLARKLGIKTGMTVLVTDAPASFTTSLSESAGGINVTHASEKTIDCVIAFVRSIADVRAAAPNALHAVGPEGLVWFAYPKKSSGVKSDLSRDVGWDPVYAAGFDSVAQISIDETWTGFRFRPKHLVGKRSR